MTPSMSPSNDAIVLNDASARQRRERK